jgi:hypothetical protein
VWGSLFFNCFGFGNAFSYVGIDFAAMVSCFEVLVAVFLLWTYTYKKSRVLVGSGSPC